MQKKRILAALLSAAMVITSAAVPVLAEDEIPVVQENELVEQDGISYAIIDDEAIAVKFNADTVGSELVIPESVNGKSVTGIEQMFTYRSSTTMNNETIESIVLPDTISDLGRQIQIRRYTYTIVSNLGIATSAAAR